MSNPHKSKSSQSSSSKNFKLVLLLNLSSRNTSGIQYRGWGSALAPHQTFFAPALAVGLPTPRTCCSAAAAPSASGIARMRPRPLAHCSAASSVPATSARGVLAVLRTHLHAYSLKRPALMRFLIMPSLFHLTSCALHTHKLNPKHLLLCYLG